MQVLITYLSLEETQVSIPYLFPVKMEFNSTYLVNADQHLLGKFTAAGRDTAIGQVKYLRGCDII